MKRLMFQAADAERDLQELALALRRKADSLKEAKRAVERERTMARAAKDQASPANTGAVVLLHPPLSLQQVFQ